jgi:hypothetical protein
MSLCPINKRVDVSAIPTIRFDKRSVINLRRVLPVNILASAQRMFAGSQCSAKEGRGRIRKTLSMKITIHDRINHGQLAIYMN